MMTELPTQATASPGAAMDRRVERTLTPWRRKRGTLITVGMLIVIVLVWRLLPAAGSTDVTADDIEVGTVERAPFADFLPVRATVAPRVTTLVGVLSGGQVEKLLAQDGSMVTSGEPLATLANPPLKLDVLTREAQIASQLGQVAGEDLGIERNRLDRAGQVAQASYDLIKARRDLTVRQQLHDQGFVSDEGIKSYAAEADYQAKRLAQLRLGSASEARITATQKQRLDDTRGRLTNTLAAVRAGLDALIIRAPATGRLTNFIIQPGQTLKPGDPAGQVDSEGSWKLEADVDEYYLSRVHVGQKANTDGARFTVSKVLPSVKDGRFRVELTFDGATSVELNRGQTLDIRITLGSTAPALVAPIGSWLNASGGSYVFVLDADGHHAQRRAIRIGRRNPEKVEILTGLQPGERIVTSATPSVKGDLLNIR